MNIEQRRKKLRQAQENAKATLTRIRRLNTSLKNWERRVKMHEKALAEEEKATLQRRIEELEGKVTTRPRRAINLEET